MARHMQLEMTDIDLREVDGEFSDGEYTRARRLSTGACPCGNRALLLPAFGSGHAGTHSY